MAGATFVARTAGTNPNHILADDGSRLDHEGFGFIECLSRMRGVYPARSTRPDPRRADQFREGPKEHDVTNEVGRLPTGGQALLRLSAFSTRSSVRPRTPSRPVNAGYQGKDQGLADWEILQKTFDRMK